MEKHKPKEIEEMSFNFGRKVYVRRLPTSHFTTFPTWIKTSADLKNYLINNKKQSL